MARFTVSPGGAFTLAQANGYFGGWPTLSSDPDALMMAFPVEGWRTSAAVVVRQEPSGIVSGEVFGSHGSDQESAWRTAQAVQSAYDLPAPPKRAAIEKLAEQWRPYRAWAMVLLHMWLRREGGPSFQRPGRQRSRG